MLVLNSADDGVTFAVKVAPRASRDEISGIENQRLKVRLTAPPAEGAANSALITLLAKTLKLPKGRIRIISGHKSRQKRLWVGGLEPSDLLNRLGL